MLSKADYTLNYYNCKYNFCILQKTETEAAAYFGIGEKKLRRLIEDNPQAKWFIPNGVKYVIKKGLFETYLNEISSI